MRKSVLIHGPNATCAVLVRCALKKRSFEYTKNYFSIRFLRLKHGLDYIPLDVDFRDSRVLESYWVAERVYFSGPRSEGYKLWMEAVAEANKIAGKFSDDDIASGKVIPVIKNIADLEPFNLDAVYSGRDLNEYTFVLLSDLELPSTQAYYLKKLLGYSNGAIPAGTRLWFCDKTRLLKFIIDAHGKPFNFFRETATKNDDAFDIISHLLMTYYYCTFDSGDSHDSNAIA